MCSYLFSHTVLQWIQIGKHIYHWHIYHHLDMVSCILIKNKNKPRLSYDNSSDGDFFHLSLQWLKINKTTTTTKTIIVLYISGCTWIFSPTTKNSNWPVENLVIPKLFQENVKTQLVLILNFCYLFHYYCFKFRFLLLCNCVNVMMPCSELYTKNLVYVYVCNPCLANTFVVTLH